MILHLLKAVRYSVLKVYAFRKREADVGQGMAGVDDGEEPPVPIPNTEVKLTCADGTAMQCGRVGSRLLLSRASDFERFLRLFCFHADLSFSHADCFLGHADFADDADFSLLLFLFHTDFTDVRRFLTCSVLDAAEKNWTNLIRSVQFNMERLFVFTVISCLLL